ncbi:hypothetical protein BX600DRAFT_242784 [Xylariales sp. PMI_506]|nr:hypothetical protein BX600DRAFT_242784 [Xylariales sp. PMI_506]
MTSFKRRRSASPIPKIDKSLHQRLFVNTDGENSKSVYHQPRNLFHKQTDGPLDSIPLRVIHDVSIGERYDDSDNRRGVSNMKEREMLPEQRGRMAFIHFDRVRSRQNFMPQYMNYDDASNGQSFCRYNRPPEPPKMKGLEENIINLRLALHSTAMAQLETAQESLIEEAISGIRTNHVAIEKFPATHSKLVSSVMGARANRVIGTPEGGERSDVVCMSNVIMEFETHLNSAEGELNRLWTS